MDSALANVFWDNIARIQIVCFAAGGLILAGALSLKLRALRQWWLGQVRQMHSELRHCPLCDELDELRFRIEELEHRQVELTAELERATDRTKPHTAAAEQAILV